MKGRYICLLAVVLQLIAALQAQTAGSRPPSAPHLGRQNGLIDSLTQSKSSQKVDYGQCIEEARQILIANTIKSYDSWVTIVSLGVAIALFAYILYLLKQRRQIFLSTAHLVAKYQNQLVTGQRSYQRLHQQYSQFLADFEQDKEPKLSQKPPFPRARNANESRDCGLDLKAKPVGTRVQGGVSTIDPSQSSNSHPQVEGLISNLRQQVTTLTQQLELERQKNRKLRGE